MGGWVVGWLVGYLQENRTTHQNVLRPAEIITVGMSEQVKTMLEVPREFMREGTLFINRCTKPDRREFIKISQAVGVGFLVMGFIGYIIKLSKAPTIRVAD